MFTIKLVGYSPEPLTPVDEMVIACDYYHVHKDVTRFNQPFIAAYKHVKPESGDWMEEQKLGDFPVVNVAYVVNCNGKNVDKVSFFMTPELFAMHSSAEQLAPFKNFGR